MIGWITDNDSGADQKLEVIDDEEIKESIIPTYAYLTVGIKGKDVKLGVDTGSVRTLISEELYNEVNYDNEFRLQQNNSRFEAVNGTKIECLGSIVIPVLFYGEERNYRTKLMFYVIRGLGLAGLLGIDELHRLQLNINLADGVCYQPKVGLIHLEMIYKEDRGIRKVVLAENVLLPAQTSCDVKVTLTGVTEGEEGEGIISPKESLSRWGLIGARVLTVAKPQVITRLLNTSDQSMGLWKGEEYGEFQFTLGSPILVSSIKENEFEDCVVENEDLDDPMAFEDYESRKLTEVDFGLTDSELNETQKAEVREELTKHKAVFQWDDEPVSFTHKIKHKIHLKPNAQPIKHKNRKFSDPQNEFIDKEVQKLIDQNIVERSESNWSSRVVLSWEGRKNRWRLCLDYRGVNSLSIPPLAHPLPNIEQLLHQFKGQVYYHTIDLFQGFHQVELDEESKPITAFSTRKGLFQYTRMPFGLSSCPTTYQALMEAVLGDLVWKTAIVYIDDVIVFGRSYNEAFERLSEVLKRLEEAKMRLRASKCRLFQSQVEFLGYVISKDGIRTCRHIVDAVLNFPQPKCVKDIQRFVGISNYYRSFIRSHSQILAPLISLTRKDSRFVWSDECQKAFELIKSKLVTPPIRNYFDSGLPIVLSTDASGRGIGATLNQVAPDGKLLLLSYGSKVLKPSEATWSTTEKELFSIVHFIKKYRHFLVNPFIVLSDHHSLRYVNSIRDASHKISRWLQYLMQFRFEVFHRNGDSRDMLIPDILSRVMMDTEIDEEEKLALKMEKPLLNLYKGESSPILLEWFKVEPPKIENLREEGMESGKDGRGEPELVRGLHLRINLKRLQKEVDKDGERDEMSTRRIVLEHEVEYLN